MSSSPSSSVVAVKAVAGWLVFLVVALAAVGPSVGKVYQVGDSKGWTIMGNVNYTAWASSKTFDVGDTIIFQYNKQFHNVLEVTKGDYRACNAASPLVTYTSGNDSITIKKRGHQYFLCGIPGHCAIGQKVDIRVAKISPATAPSPSSSPSSSPPSSGGSAGSAGAGTGTGTGTGPSPQKNTAPAAFARTGYMGWALALAVVAAGACFS